MQTFRLLALIAFIGLFFSSCEKLELEDHCPEEEQIGPTWNPGDVRVDNSLSKITQIEESLQDDVFGEGSGDSDDSQDDSDDMVNDDSDNEDENQSGRKAVPTSSNSGYSAPGLQK